MKNNIRFVSPIFLILSAGKILAQTLTGSLEGTVQDANEKALYHAQVTILESHQSAFTDSSGHFKINKIAAGEKTARMMLLGYEKKDVPVTITAGQTATLNSQLPVISATLEDVTVEAERHRSELRHLPETQGTMIYSSTKNDVIDLKKVQGNVGVNNARQIFAKVAGINLWDLDGNGLQYNIAMRGLNPHRSYETIMEQNGYHYNSDLYGYPEAHYNVAAPGVDHIEIIRGSAALQYGPQFGGVVNFVLKQGDLSKPLSFETNESTGSDGTFSAFNAVGGQVGKINYYGFLDFRRSDGYRAYSGYNYWNGYASIKYSVTPELTLGVEFSHMYYVVQLAGGLNDSMFKENPYQSPRARNFFNPIMNIPVVTLNWRMGNESTLDIKLWGLFGQRNSVQFLNNPQVGDTINKTLDSYNPRQVDRDYYYGESGEARYSSNYNIGKLRQTFSGGIKIFHELTNRDQLGKGTTGFDFDLSLTGPYGTDLDYYTTDYAIFAQNLFNITSKFSVTPGVRYELLNTYYNGYLFIKPDSSNDFTNSGTKKQRSIPLFGVGARYKITDHISAYGNFSQAYRPVLYSDLIPSASIAIIDPNMKDAYGYNSDLGVRGNLGEVLNFDVDGYYLYYARRVGTLTLPNDNGIGTYVYKTNVGTSASRGFESYLGFHVLRLFSTSYANDLNLFSNATWDQATYIKGSYISAGKNISLVGNKLENAPEWILREGITYSYKTISATLLYSYVSSNYSDANNTVFSSNGATGIVPAYHVFDLSASYTLRNYSLQAGINNLTNEKYFTRRTTIYPGPGILPSDRRTWFVALNAKF